MGYRLRQMGQDRRDVAAPQSTYRWRAAGRAVTSAQADRRGKVNWINDGAPSALKPWGDAYRVLLDRLAQIKTGKSSEACPTCWNQALVGGASTQHTEPWLTRCARVRS